MAMYPSTASAFGGRRPASHHGGGGTGINLNDARNTLRPRPSVPRKPNRPNSQRRGSEDREEKSSWWSWGKKRRETEVAIEIERQQKSPPATRPFEELFHDGVKLIQTADFDKPTVLVFGGTGAGKSTLINHLMGRKLEIIEDEDSLDMSNANVTLKVKGNEKGGPKIGHSAMESETLYPSMYRGGLLDLTFCDTPGFGDSHGMDHQVIAALFTQYYLSRLTQLKGFLLVIDGKGINVERSKSLRELTEFMLHFVENFPEDLANLQMFTVLTKMNSNAKRVRNHLTKCVDQCSKEQTSLKAFLGSLIDGPIAVFPPSGEMDQQELEFLTHCQNQRKEGVIASLVTEAMMRHFEETAVYRDLQKLQTNFVSAENLASELEQTIDLVHQAHHREQMEPLVQAKEANESAIRNAQSKIADLKEEIKKYEGEKQYYNSTREVLHWRDSCRKPYPDRVHVFTYNGGSSFPISDYKIETSNASKSEVVSIDRSGGYLQVKVKCTKWVYLNFKDLWAEVKIWIAYKYTKEAVQKRAELSQRIASCEKRINALRSEIKEKEEQNDEIQRNTTLLNNELQVKIHEGAMRKREELCQQRDTLCDQLKEAQQGLKFSPQTLTTIAVLKTAGMCSDLINDLEKNQEKVPARLAGVIGEVGKQRNLFEAVDGTADLPFSQLEEMSMLRNIFRKLDADDNQRVDEHELVVGFKALNISNANDNAKKMMDVVKGGQHGRKDLDFFTFMKVVNVLGGDFKALVLGAASAAGAPSTPKLDEMNQLRAVFGVLDANGNARVDLDELKAGLKKLNVPDADEKAMMMIKQGEDSDDEAELDFFKFLHAVNALGSEFKSLILGKSSSIDLAAIREPEDGAAFRSRFNIGREIGEGGFGKTYLATDKNHHGKQVLVKELTNTTASAKELFRREASKLISINHPNIPKILGYYEDGNTYYIAMDYIDGLDLEKFVEQNGEFSQERTITMLRKIFEILEYTHSKKILHRDIKAANILFAQGDYFLIDFGACNTVNSMGVAGTIIGTPGYVPPEIMQGAGQLESDFFMLGATALHVLTGQHPGLLIQNGKTLNGIIQDLVSTGKITQSLADLLNAMVLADPGARRRAIAAHPDNYLRDAPEGDIDKFVAEVKVEIKDPDFMDHVLRPGNEYPDGMEAAHALADSIVPNGDVIPSVVDCTDRACTVKFNFLHISGDLIQDVLKLIVLAMMDEFDEIIQKHLKISIKDVILTDNVVKDAYRIFVISSHRYSHNQAPMDIKTLNLMRFALMVSSAGLAMTFFRQAFLEKLK